MKSELETGFFAHSMLISSYGMLDDTPKRSSHNQDSLLQVCFSATCYAVKLTNSFSLVIRKKTDSSFLLTYLFAVAFRLFQERAKPDDVIESIPAKDKSTDVNRIRCPLCGWQPNPSSRWYCGDCDYPEYFYGGCGTAWNTFTTRGLCPGCAHQWRWTICLRCCGWSRHEEWYSKPSD